MQQPQATGVSPLKVFGKMLKFYRNRSGLTSDQLGALVNLSGSAIRKVESGPPGPHRAPGRRPGSRPRPPLRRRPPRAVR
jgi:hypothetical protein